MVRYFIWGDSMALGKGNLASFSVDAGIAIRAFTPQRHPMVGELHTKLLSNDLLLVEHPVTGTVTSVRVPLRANGALPDTLRPAPTFDQHSDEVLRDWIACREERVAALRASGVVGGQPGRT